MRAARPRSDRRHGTSSTLRRRRPGGRSRLLESAWRLASWPKARPPVLRRNIRTISLFRAREEGLDSSQRHHVVQQEEVMAPSLRNRTWTISVLCILALAGLVLSLAGDLEPPGSPSPTMESLIRNDDLPLTITAPGSYALAENLDTGGGGITISASNVTIDLRG